LKNIAYVKTEELIYQLKHFKADEIIDKYIKESPSLKVHRPGEIIKNSFDHSTYRAFHHESPRRVKYPQWRWYKKPDKLVKKLNSITTQEDYDKFLYDVAKSLVKDWGNKNNLCEPTRMNDGIALKIVNLIMKHFTYSSNCDKQKLECFLHVPWDSNTLKPLKQLWTLKPEIPINASQGFVKRLEIYKNLHDFISEITEQAGVPRIYYEFLKWDRPQQDKK